MILKVKQSKQIFLNETSKLKRASSELHFGRQRLLDGDGPIKRRQAEADDPKD